MAFRSRPKSIKRINTRLENFLAQTLGAENVEYYDQESCIQENKKSIFLNKFMFKLLLICDDRFYITDNPPTNLDNFILFEDVIELRTVSDHPKFLTGADRENSLHIVIDYYKNPVRKQELKIIKNKVIELKKSMIYSKSVDNKLLESEMNTSRSSFISKKDADQDLSLISTYRELTNYMVNGEENLANECEMTNRTNKSVRFNDIVTINESENVKEANERYKILTELVAKTEGYKFMSEKDLGLFTLDLPLTPRSLDGKSIPDYSSLATNRNIIYLNYQSAKNIQDLNDQINSNFIKDCDKIQDSLDIYILNPRSHVFQSLRQAHFLSKIRNTINYHITLEEQIKMIENNFESKSSIDKQYKFIKSQIFKNMDDLDQISNLYDNLMQLTFDFKFIKKLFWNNSDLFGFSINQLNRYMPNSAASMKLGIKSAKRRLKELEACIAFIETLAIMFQETEFYSSRNLILYEEKCKYMNCLFRSLICEPESVKYTDMNIELSELKNKLDAQISNFYLVSSVLLWELMHCMSLNSWNCTDLTLEIFIKNIEYSSSLKIFLKSLIGELSKIVNSSDTVLLSAKETIIFYKSFSVLLILVEKSNTASVIEYLKSNFYEEFKYYFNEDRIRLKTYNHYPISKDLLAVVKKLQRNIV